MTTGVLPNQLMPFVSWMGMRDGSEEQYGGREAEY